MVRLLLNNEHPLLGNNNFSNDGIHLTHISTMTPSLLHKRRVIDVNMHELKNYYSQLTHVVVRVLPNDDPVLKSCNLTS